MEINRLETAVTFSKQIQLFKDKGIEIEDTVDDLYRVAPNNGGTLV